MATTEPKLPGGYEATGTAWTTRSGALVYRIREITGFNRYEHWFCAGCLSEYGRVGDLAATAQAHADQCTAMQV
jgi:hypothetical protein